MKTRTRIAATGAAAVVATVAFAGQASAAETASCSTTGARGSMRTTYPSGDQWPYGEFKIALSVTDTSADGYHVRVRLLTKWVGSQQVATWKWHALHAGSGETLTRSTTAQSSYGIEKTGVEVARFEGDTKLNSCTDWS
ncbi:hypothetical protein [Streptomyces sp. P17]|uniref:hypothetical protein n=1 Tax=Streptomyces sp. P17 TaxID=3074716 RepID=UPI0028F3FF12|nr:hypothetical protein [Streptomyces sp. P17]MDT9695525.1 hypothetical protein [Streptomyces sp. P17]